MKKAGNFGYFLTAAVLGIVLLGPPSVPGEELAAPTNTVETNLVSSTMDTNAPLAVTLPADLDPGSAYAELVRLVQAGVDEGVILSYVTNSLRFFELDADRIIYLTDLGTSPDIIKAMMENDQKLIQKGIAPVDVQPAQQPAEQAVEQAPATNDQPPVVSNDYFYDSLAPYGAWVYVEGYGRCWRPTVVIHNSGWQPYCDNGRWVYTDCGWYWMSNYSWGWATFHYGRWFHHARYGWCWWPDTVWAPSWVCWRYDRDYSGWAPLPPYAVYRPGVGFFYRGSAVSVGFNFGLNVNTFTFVATRNFCDSRPWRHRVEDRQTRQRIYDNTTVIHKVDYDRGKQRIVNLGISPNDITTVTKQKITPVSIRHSQSGRVGSNRHEQLDSRTGTLIVDRPRREGPGKQASPQPRRSTPRPDRTDRPATPPPERTTPQPGNRRPERTPSPAGTSTPESTQSTGRDSHRVAPPSAPRTQTPRATPETHPQTQQPRTTPPRTTPRAKPQPQQPRPAPQTTRPQPAAPPQRSGGNSHTPPTGSGTPNPGHVQNNGHPAPAPNPAPSSNRSSQKPKVTPPKKSAQPAPAAKPKAKTRTQGDDSDK